MLPRHRSSAAPLAWLYATLIVYASLYPFASWRIPGVSPFAFLGLAWPRYWTWFDLVANLVGYAPLGALVFGAAVRSGRRPLPALALALLAGTGLSLSMELLQNFLPRRVASNVDLGLNSVGTLLGAALGWFVDARGGVQRWQAARERWFIRRSAGALALLLLWPVGLLFPLPVPLAQGQVIDLVRDGIVEMTAGTPLAASVETWLASATAPGLLPPGAEFSLIVLGLLAPCLVAFSVAPPGWRRIVLIAGAVALGCLTTTLSTALNFGPMHLLAWSTPQVFAALGCGAVLAAMLSAAPARVAAALGLVALITMVMLVAQAPPDPYFAQSLQAWEQGRFIRFHGAARWVGWLWPYIAILYLLTRLAAREEPPKMRS